MTAPACSFRVGVKLSRVDCSAGASPKRMPVRSETSSVKARMRRSSLVERLIGASPVGRNLMSNRLAQTATSKPEAPPRAESSRLSTMSCRTMRLRPAPSANRIAISFSRPIARASKRLATLAQAIRRTKPTSAINTHSGVENCSRSEDRPRAPGRTSIVDFRN